MMVAAQSLIIKWGLTNQCLSQLIACEEESVDFPVVFIVLFFIFHVFHSFRNVMVAVRCASSSSSTYTLAALFHQQDIYPSLETFFQEVMTSPTGLSW